MVLLPLEAILQALRTLFRYLTSPSSLYAVCFIGPSPPAFRHTQNFPFVKYTNKPIQLHDPSQCLYLFIVIFCFPTTVLMKPLIPKPSTTFWLSLKHTSQFSSYLTVGEYLTVLNAPSFLKALFLWLLQLVIP